MKNRFLSHSIVPPMFVKRFILLFMVILIAASPLTHLILDIYDDHYELFEIIDEDDLKEKVVFLCLEESLVDKFCIIQDQSSLNPDIFLSDFSPDVPFLPPKNI